MIGGESGNLVTLSMSFAHGQTADSQTVEGKLAQKISTLFSEIVMAGSLNNPEQSLWRVASRLQGPPGPAVGELHRRLGLGVRRSGRNALIEHHHDIAADRLLHLDTRFRREQIRISVHVTLETRPLLVHRPRARERENLKSAGVREYRTIPVHETMDAAKFFEDLGSGTKQQVIRVGQEYARARRLQTLDRLPLHRRLRADRHEDRRFDLAMERVKGGSARFRCSGLAFQGEIKTGHCWVKGASIAQRGASRQASDASK